jgi:predicted  nucleic acid-binding Zn-ribbon protein
VRRKILVLTLVLVAAGAGLSVRARAAAQATRATDQDVQPALLVEVRGRRAAMEQMASAGPQVQLALGRLQLQEQRVNNLLRRIESVQNEVAGAIQETDKARQEVSRLEGALKSGNLPPDERQHVEEMLPMFRANTAQAAAKVQRLQVEESGLTQELATEQGRWTDINQRLEELERALTRK